MPKSEAERLYDISVGEFVIGSETREAWTRRGDGRVESVI